MPSPKRARNSRPSPPPSHFITTVAQAGHQVCTGKTAIKGEYRNRVATDKGVQWLASWDLDEAFRSLEPRSARWDYALAVQAGEECLYWLEVHPASSTGQVDEMIAKLTWLQAKLRQPELAPLQKLTQATQTRNEPAFRWLYTGDNRIGQGAQARRRLAQHGLHPPERQITLR